jgi:hypothetical protein
MLFDFKTRKWMDWLTESGRIAFPTWSRDSQFLFYQSYGADVPTFRRIKVGEVHSQSLVDLKSLQPFIEPRLGPWSGVSPDGSPLFVRDLSTDEAYSLELQLP